MEEWKEYKLGDFMDFNPKIVLKKNTVARKIAMDQLIPNTRDIYSWTYEPYSGGAKFQNGDTIMARITPCLENGKHAFVSLLDDNEIAYGSTEFIVIRGRKGISDNSFVYYLSKFPSFKETAIKSMVGSSGRQRAQVDVLENLSMRLPALPEQTLIASILSSLDDKIAVNKKICENLEEQAQALFKHWFVDFAPFKDGQFVESELGLIPEGWRVVTLGDIAELRKPSIKPQDNILYTHYSIPAFDNGMKPSVDEGSTIKSNKFGINDAAILLSKLNPSTKRIWYTGNVSENSVSSTEFLPFYSKNKELTPFIYCYLNCDSNYREIANGAKGTTNSHQRIDANSILTRGLAYSEEAIKKFCDCCQYLMELILEANQESSRLATLRDTLLPKLMSGQIKVNQIEKYSL